MRARRQRNSRFEIRAAVGGTGGDESFSYVLYVGIIYIYIYYYTYINNTYFVHTRESDSCNVHAMIYRRQKNNVYSAAATLNNNAREKKKKRKVLRVIRVFNGLITWW